MRKDFAVHLHLATSPVWVFLSPASYWYIIDTCCGTFHFSDCPEPLHIPSLLKSLECTPL